ncbi:restriction endonuclease subunit S [Algibacter sp. TI.3.09]|uniref:restriction endonuclease subunit S n=1 Tax=Algibacter sp. TI.3.09 TaxID=3121298 RepID=UPI00311E23F3
MATQNENNSASQCEEDIRGKLKQSVIANAGKQSVSASACCEERSKLDEAISPKKTKSLKPKLRFNEFEGEWDLHILKNLIDKIGSGWSPKCLSYPAKKGEWGSLKTTSISWQGYNPNENKKLPGKLEARKDIEVNKDDILITRVGPKDRVGVVVHVNKVWTKLMVSDNMFRLRLKGNINPAFVPLILGSNSVQKSWKNKIAGLASAQVVINQGILFKTKLQLPSLPEQQKIANFLTAVDTKLQQLTTKKERLAQYKKGVMQQLFSQQLRFKPDVIARTQDDVISPNETEFPDWEEKRLGEVFKIFNGYAFSSKDSTSEGVLWVKIADVGIQEMKNDSISFLPYSFLEKHKKFILEKGDYILALTRPILNGKLKIARVNEFFSNSLLNQRVGKIVTENNKDFVYFLLQQDFLIKSIENNIAGSDPPNLSPSEINNLKVMIPELKEQKKIANYLSAIDLKIEAVQTQITKTQAFKKGLLQQMFV